MSHSKVLEYTVGIPGEPEDRYIKVNAYAWVQPEDVLTNYWQIQMAAGVPEAQDKNNWHGAEIMDVNEFIPKQ